MLTDVQIERWRQLWQEAGADTAWVAHNQNVDARRAQVRGEIVSLLNDFLTGKVPTEAFQTTFDLRTRTDWEGFGLKGLSGAMFLNKLVKYLGDGTGPTGALRSTLRLPKSEDDGRAQMQSFQEYLGREIQAGHATRGQIQPARVPFFVSCWWHLQDTERWPIFYLSGRKVLELDGLYLPTQDPVRDYFSFRRCFLELASTLKLTSWALEHLFYWCDALNEKAADADPGLDKAANDDSDETDDGEDGAEPESDVSHAQVQWLLAKIGRRLGCKIWVAANDRNREWNGERLGDLSVESLPSLGLDPASQAVIRLIDVLWLKGANQVAAAFEVEHTTSIYSGLLRMSDLTACSPNLNFPLYIVAPESRLSRVRKELSRPTFQALELHRRCGYFSNQKLVAEADAIMQWANDPKVMEKLASKVPEVNNDI